MPREKPINISGILVVEAMELPHLLSISFVVSMTSALISREAKTRAGICRTMLGNTALTPSHKVASEFNTDRIATMISEDPTAATISQWFPSIL